MMIMTLIILCGLFFFWLGDLSERWLSACFPFFAGSLRAYTPVLFAACSTGCANTMELCNLVSLVPLPFFGPLLLYILWCKNMAALRFCVKSFETAKTKGLYPEIGMGKANPFLILRLVSFTTELFSFWAPGTGSCIGCFWDGG